jgi:formylglycine-generating enzyme required for sulfatase activity
LIWNDAVAYVKWLGQKTGKPYRPLSEAEWEYVARARTMPGSYPRFSFGDNERDLCQYGNFFDQMARASIKTGIQTATAAPCNDGHFYTAPAGHYKPNAFGLYDMFGNADQWTIDCWHRTYDGAPADGSPWTTGCTINLPTLYGESESDVALNQRIVRGGGWFVVALAPTVRNSRPKTLAMSDTGFRVARTFAP